MRVNACRCLLLISSVVDPALRFDNLLIIGMAHVPQLLQVLVIGNVSLVVLVLPKVLILPNHVAQLIVLVLQLDQSIHAFFQALLLVEIALSNIDLFSLLRLLLLHDLGGYCFLSLLLPLLEELLRCDLLLLNFAHLMRHVIHLGLKYEVLQRFVSLCEVDANLACFIVQRALERPPDYFGIYVTVILVEVVANERHRKWVVTPPLKSEAMVAFLCYLDHGLLDICPF